jgi:hypothetical protein
MRSRHSPHRTVRAYLLGTLPATESAALEEEYFVNPNSLRNVEKEEDCLIADYLAGRLRSKDLQRFEERYLQHPLLAAKLKAASQARESADPRRIRWALPAMSVVAMLIVGIAGWTLRSGSSPDSKPALTAQLSETPLQLNLTPGVSKSSDRNDDVIRQPIPAAGLRLKLELPGVTSSKLYGARVLRVESDGRWSPVWKASESIQSSFTETGPQELIVTLPGNLKLAGDYMVELTFPGEEIAERYMFRVASSE